MLRKYLCKAEAAINAGVPPPDEIEANALPVDSDEETELVMAAVARNISRPVEISYFIPVRKKSQYHRVRDLMASAIRPRQPLYGGDGLVGNGFGNAKMAIAES